VNTYRAEVIIEQVIIVEVQAPSSWEAKEAIQHNQGKEVAPPTYQNPRIEQLKLIDVGR